MMLVDVLAPYSWIALGYVCGVIHLGLWLWLWQRFDSHIKWVAGRGLQKTSGPYWENLHLLCKCGHSRGGHYYHAAHCIEGEQEDCPCEGFALEEKL